MVEGSGFENRRSRKATRGSNPLSSAICNSRVQSIISTSRPPTDALERGAQEGCVLKFLWAQQDLNLRLRPCEERTLPLSYAPNST